LELRNLLQKYSTQGGATLGSHDVTDRYNVPMRLPGPLAGAAAADAALAREPEVQQFNFGGPVRHEVQFADGGAASPSLMDQFLAYLRNKIGITPGGGPLPTNPHENGSSGSGRAPSGGGVSTLEAADRQSG
jgi:hypothetical protein